MTVGGVREIKFYRYGKLPWVKRHACAAFKVADTLLFIVTLPAIFYFDVI